MIGGIIGASLDMKSAMQIPPPPPPPRSGTTAAAASSTTARHEKLVLRGVHFDFNKCDNIRPATRRS